MHYSRKAFSKNGNPTIVALKNETAKLGQRIGFSEIVKPSTFPSLQLNFKFIYFRTSQESTACTITRVTHWKKKKTRTSSSGSAHSKISECAYYCVTVIARLLFSRNQKLKVELQSRKWDWRY